MKVLLMCALYVNCVWFSRVSSETAPGLPSPTQMEMYEQRASQTRRYPSSVSSSPQKDMQPNVRRVPVLTQSCCLVRFYAPRVVLF